MSNFLVQPDCFVALRLPSDTHKVLQITPNTTISLGKFGSFRSNCLLGRPLHLTYEIVEGSNDSKRSDLRVVTASELHKAAIVTNTPTPEQVDGEDGAEYEVVGEGGEVILRTNQNTIDDSNRQTLSMAEIEKLKQSGSITGPDLVAKIIASHTAIDQKTPFSLAKYTLRKARKFLRRFTVLPLDVYTLTQWILMEKDPQKTLELRNESIALIGCWANVYYGGANTVHFPESGAGQIGGGRWLVVDETGGLLTAAMAERMGLLDLLKGNHSHSEGKDKVADEIPPPTETEANGGEMSVDVKDEETTMDLQPLGEEADDEMNDGLEGTNNGNGPTKNQNEPAKKPKPNKILPMSASTNTITVVHSAAQPNLSLLKYFSYASEHPNPQHPLYTHLKSLNWLQLLHPDRDTGYIEPEYISPEVFAGLRGGKRSNYLRKRRRWNRIKGVTDEVRAGGYDGLAVASNMSPVSVLRHLVPLLRGGAQVAVYSPTVEPLVELADVYSNARRTGFVTNPSQEMPCEDYPLDPRLLLATMVQTARIRRWQCLPGRTHPLMTDRGGAEGYLFTGTRVLPVEGKVAARGNFAKRRKVETAAKAGNESTAHVDQNVQDSDQSRNEVIAEAADSLQKPAEAE
ncbi:MAG: tRNA (adenine(58)-N(1))-methyltransferase non-catalytic subunit trm6 [Vezdaea aestivalis]|nr:MAG: tRNA (adenine(58)-N(1))-methyltransferase non-catalytic subunit trm6 [Vezdaea aestivalis]